MDDDKSTTVEAAVDPAKPPRIDRRRSRRFLTELRVRLCWQDEGSRLCDGPGAIRNVSAGGLGIEFSQRLPIDQLLTVRTFSSALQCVVRHVQERTEGFLVGVQVLRSPDGLQETLERLSAAVEASERRSP